MKVTLSLLFCMLLGLFVFGVGLAQLHQGNGSGLLLVPLGGGLFGAAGSLFFTPEGRYFRRTAIEGRRA